LNRVSGFCLLLTVKARHNAGGHAAPHEAKNLTRIRDAARNDAPSTGNKSPGTPVFAIAVVGSNGYAGATGCEPLSDFAHVSDHGIFLPPHPRFAFLETDSLLTVF